MTFADTQYSFVLCNEGFTIERYIHGWEQDYNDIQEWDFVNLPLTFGAKDQYKGYRIKTREELTKLFANQEFASAPYLQVSLFTRTAGADFRRAFMFADRPYSWWKSTCPVKMPPQP